MNLLSNIGGVVKVEIKYKGIPSAKKLDALVNKKTDHFDRYELKPSRLKVTFSAKHHKHFAEVAIQGPDLYFRASASAEDHLTALEIAFERLDKQLSKWKGKIKFHKSRVLSHEGALSRMNPQLEHRSVFAIKSRRGGRAA